MRNLTNYPRHFPTEEEIQAAKAYRSAVLLENHPIFKTLDPATRSWIKATARDKPAGLEQFWPGYRNWFKANGGNQPKP